MKKEAGMWKRRLIIHYYKRGRFLKNIFLRENLKEVFSSLEGRHQLKNRR